MQRYSCDGYMDQTDDGAWVEHSDAAALISAKDAEIERLTRERDYRERQMDDNRKTFTKFIDDLWQAIIVAHHPTYGDWEYPAQAHRHLVAEVDDIRRRLALAVAEVKAWRACKGFTNERVFWAAAWSWEDGNCVLSSRSSTDADPVLRAMIGGGE